MNLKLRTHVLVIALAFASIVLSVSTANAATDTWTGASTTFWNNAGNWNPAAAPVNNDLLVFDAAGAGSLTNDLTSLSVASITFNSGAGVFTLGGNALTTGNITNNSSNLQTISMPLTITAGRTFAGGTGGLAITGSVTLNNAAVQTLTLTGAGTIANSLVNSAAGPLILAVNASGANWTMKGNNTNTLAAGSFNILNGTFNYGDATNAPTMTITAGSGTDNQISTGGVFNMVNGSLTLPIRLNTANTSGTATFNQTGGTISIANQVQMDNAAGGTAVFNLSGGNLSTPGTIFVASRGVGTLTISGSSVVTCNTVDVSRDIGATTGTVNLDGGTLILVQNGATAPRISTATANSNNTAGATGIFNFNGGILRAGAASTTFIAENSSNQGNGVPLTVNIKAGGAKIDSNGFNITSLKPFLHSGAGTDGGLTKLGTGTLTLTPNAASTYNGPTTVAAGTLQAGNSNALSSASTVVLGSATTNGTLDLNGQTVTVAGLSVASGATAASQIIGNSSTTADATLTIATGTSTFAGVIQDVLGAGTRKTALTMSSGSLTLTGTNSYTGNTTVNGGTLLVNSSLAAGSTVNINGGTLGGTGTVNGAVNINSGGTLGGTGTFTGAVTLQGGNIAPGNSPGTVNLANLVVSSGNFNLDLISPDPGGTHDLINVSGTANFTGASTLTPSSVPTAGTYTILTAGTLTGTAPTVSGGGNTRTQYQVNFNATPGVLSVTVSGGPKSLTWTGAIDNNWDLIGTSNWDSGGAEKFYNQDSVTFTDSGANKAIALNTQVAPGSVTFNNSSGNDYSITGGGNIVDSGLAGGTSLTKMGTGTATLGTSNSYLGATAIQNGTLVLGNSGAIPSTSSVTLGSGSNSGALDLNGNSVTIGALATSGGGGANIIGNSSTSSSSTLTVNGTGTFGGVIQNTLGGGNQTVALTVAGGALTLAGNNTYTGDTTINSGATLQLGTGSATGSVASANNIADNGSLIINRTGTMTIPSSIFGSGSYLQQGSATVTLSGSNSYTGTTTVSGGTLLLTNGNSGGGAITIGSGATLQIDNGGSNGSIGSGAVTNSGTLIFNSSNTSLTVNNIIGGSGGLQQIGSGTTALGGANTFTGAVAVTAGTLKLGNVAALGTTAGGVSISGTGTVDINGLVLNTTEQFNVQGAGVGGNGALVNNGAGTAGNQISRFTLTGDATIGGSGRWDFRNNNPVIDLAGFTLTKTGANQISIVAGTVNPGGHIVINQGLFSIETTSTVNGAGDITFNDQTTFQLFGSAANTLNMNRQLNINGTVALFDNSGIAVTVASPTTLNGTLNSTTTNAAGTVTLSGNIGEASAGSGFITKNGGASVLILSGANTYSGGTTVGAGTLQLGSATALGASSAPLTVNAGTLDLHGFGVSVGALNGSGGTINSAAGNAVLTLGNGNTTGSYSGVIQNGSATVGITKVGAGTQTLGSTNTYTGNTTISAGTLALAGGASISNSGQINVSSGGTFDVTAAGGYNIPGTQTITNNGAVSGALNVAGTLSGTGTYSDVTLNSGSSSRPGSLAADGNVGTVHLANLTVNSGSDFHFDFASGSNSDLIAVSGTANFSGNSTITPAGGTAPNGVYTIFTAGTLTVGTLPTPPSAARTTYTVHYNDGVHTDPLAPVTNTITLEVVGSAKSLTWTGNSPGDGSTWDIQTTQNWSDNGGTTTNEKFFNLDSVTFNNVSSNNNINLTASVTPGNVTVDNDASHNYTISGVGSIGGATGLTKNGVGTLTIATNNTFSGTVSINAGTITVGNGGSSGSLGTGPVVNNATLAFNRNDASAFANTISGTGGVQQNGSGNTTLSGTNSYTGATTINAGILSATSLANIGANSSIGAGNNASGATNSASLVINGGTLRWAASSTQSTDRGFTLTQSGGTLDSSPTASPAGLTISGPIAYSGSGARILTLSGTDPSTSPLTNNTLSSIIADGTGGATSLVKSGNNAWVLSGTNTFTGGVTVNSGTLRLANVNAAGANASTITVNTGGNAVAALTAVTYPNPITFSGGTLGAVSGVTGFSGNLTATASTTSTILISDPQNLATNSEMAFTGTLLGSGNINVVAGTNNTVPDTGVGMRLRGTGASNYTGTLTIGNNVKGEIQSATVGAFSPLGTGKIVLTAGIANLGGGQGAPASGGYSEFNLKNNSTGNIIFGNDMEITGTGLAVLNPNGSAANTFTITMGNLKIGNGQELGVYLAAAPDHTVIFPTVTLNGGNATFSPKTNLFGAPGSTGSDLSLGTISELVAGSSITMNGLRTLFLTGNNSFTGGTTINSGTVQMGNAGALGPSSNPLTVNGGNTAAPGTLDLHGFNLAVGALNGSNSSPAATITSAAAGAVQLTIGTGNATGSYAGAITNGSGTVSVVKVGSGTQTFSGDSTYTGTTSVNGGTLALSSGGTNNIAGSKNVTVASGATLDVTGVTGSGTGFTGFGIASGQTLTNNATVTGTVAAASGGTLAGSGTYGDVTMVSGGTVAPGSGTGTSSVTLNNLTVSGGRLSLDLASGNGNSDLVNVTNTASFTAPSSISIASAPSTGSFTYTILQAGSSLTANGNDLNIPTVPTTTRSTYTLHFNDGQNSRPGGNTITLDIVAVAPKSLFWTGNDDTTSWDLNTHQNWTDGAITEKYFDLDSVTFDDAHNTNNNRSITLNTIAVIPTAVTVTGSGNYTISGSGSISGSTSLTKSGTGTLTLSTTNTYTGGTFLNAGTLATSNDNSLGDTSVGITFNGGALRATSSFTTARAMSLVGAGTLQADASQTLTQTGTISGAGALHTAGAGTIVLSGANTWTGGLVIDAGVTQFTSLAALNSGSPTAVSFGPGSTGTFQLNGIANVVISGLSTDGGNPGSAVVSNGSSTAISLTVNNAADCTFAGVFQNNGTGALNLVKNGAGTLTLSGASSNWGTFNAAAVGATTTINAGIIKISADANLGVSVANPTILFNGGTLEVTSSFSTAKIVSGPGTTATQNVIVDSGVTLTMTANGAIRNNGQGAFVKTGTGTLVLTGQNNQLDNGLNLNAGTVIYTAGGAGGGQAGVATLTAAAGTTFIMRNDANTDYGSNGTNSQNIVVSGSNSIMIDRANAGAGTTHSFNNLTINGTNTVVSVSAGNLITSGTGGLTSAGTTTLGGDATISVTKPAAAGLLLSLNTVTGTNRNLTIDGTGNTTIGGAVTTGTGSLTKTGSGTLTLSAANTYSGGTTVNAGTVIVSHVSALGTGGLSINNTATTQLQAGLSAPIQLPSLTITGGMSLPAMDVASNMGDFDLNDLSSSGLAQQGSPLSGGGGGAAAPAVVQPVPEPSAIVLAVLGAAASVAVVRRRRRS